MAVRIETSTILPDGYVTPDLLSDTFALPIAKNVQRPLARSPIRLGECRKQDFSAVLPTSNTTGDAFLKITPGTHGTHSVLIQSADFASASGSQSTKFEVILPPNYEDGESVAIVIRAKLGTDASVTKTLDITAYAADGDGTVGSDLCATAAQNLTTSYANYTFVITPTSLVAGDRVEVLLTTALNDGVAGSGVVASISNIELQCDTRG